MAYIITLTDGTVFATIADGTTNTSSSMTLVGKNYAGYGAFLDENFIHLLENSADTSAPSAPLTGQLWFDKTNTVLKCYTGTGFKVISGATASASTPSGAVGGDLWFDTTNQQLKVYTGSTWIVVGPAYSAAQGTSGAIPETIQDSVGATKYITSLYVNNNRVGIVYDAAQFTPQASLTATFPTIYPGITLTATNSPLFVGSTGRFGTVSATGNVIGGNVNTAGLVTATGNVTGGNVNTGGLITATGNITGGNLRSATLSLSGNIISAVNASSSIAAGTTISAVGNIDGGNVRTAGLVSATGNINGGNLIAAGAVSATGNISATGNVLGGNVTTGGLVSATGNITSAGNSAATYFLGNGYFLTGLSAAVSVSQIQNGTSRVQIGASDGNANVSIGGVSNVVVFTSTGTSFANAVTVPSIEKSGTNAVGNIGSSSNYFNRVFATATTALYADVAERFAADEYLEAGTVVELGGSAEITRSRAELSENIFGVISTRPAYLMNGGAGEDRTHPPVAMTGRVPVKVTGQVRKGDRLVSAGDGIARAAAPGEATAFNVIGRALEHKFNNDGGTVEAIVTIK